MGLNVCCSAFKYLMVLINLLFWLIGLGIIGCAVWMLTDPTFLFSIGDPNNSYLIGLYIFLIIGSIMVFIAFLGCCGAFKESQCMLITFFCCLLIMLVAEVAAGAWAFHNRDHLNDMIEKSVSYTVTHEYSRVQSRTIAFDTFQKKLKCCGAKGPSDWAASIYNDKDLGNKEVISLVVSKIIPNYKVPESCCRDDVDIKACAIGREFAFTTSLFPSIYEQGCARKLVSIVEDNWIIVLIVTLVIALLEIFALIFSLALCCAIRDDDNYKA